MVSGGGVDSEPAREAHWDGFYEIGQGLQTSPVDNEEHRRNFCQSYDILEKSFWFFPPCSLWALKWWLLIVRMDYLLLGAILKTSFFH